VSYTQQKNISVDAALINTVNVYGLLVAA